MAALLTFGGLAAAVEMTGSSGPRPAIATTDDPTPDVSPSVGDGSTDDDGTADRGPGCCETEDGDTPRALGTPAPSPSASPDADGDNSGPGHAHDDADDNSGPSENSGPGNADDGDDTDNSGPGSGDDDDDDDNSGPGSGDED
ncbi:MAG TPA: hypothetical protein VJ927_09495 [Actinomycetota bacterium]|nr:hypothetical protein [Actinomycetota bacterium]